MSVKINIIKPTEKKKLTFRDLKCGEFFFSDANPIMAHYLCMKLGKTYDFMFVRSGEILTTEINHCGTEVILADVVIDVRIKE